MDDNILSSSDTTTNSILEPYLKTQEKNNTRKDDEQRQTKRKCKDANLEANNTSNTLNNERPNKRMCNAERNFPEKGQRVEGDAHRVEEKKLKKKSNLKTSL
ncbi:hypothetical protein Tco_0431906 [Tanacetum coccineum]